MRRFSSCRVEQVEAQGSRKKVFSFTVKFDFSATKNKQIGCSSIKKKEKRIFIKTELITDEESETQKDVVCFWIV